MLKRLGTVLIIIAMVAQLTFGQIGQTTTIRHGSTLPTSCQGSDVFMLNGVAEYINTSPTPGTCIWALPGSSVTIPSTPSSGFLSSSGGVLVPGTATNAPDLGTNGQVYNVKAWNASASSFGTSVNGTLPSGSTIIPVSNPGDFVIGQGISVAGAGLSGALYVDTVALVSGSYITVSTPTSTTVTSATVYHDDTARIQAASNAACTAGAGTVMLPTGFYRTSSPLVPCSGVVYSGPAFIAEAHTGAEIYNNTSDVWASSGTTTGGVFQFMTIETGSLGGHLFNWNGGAGGVTTWQYLTLVQRNPAKSVFDSSTGTVTQLGDNWNHLYVTMAAGCAAPGWNISSNTENTTSWDTIWYTENATCTNYAIKLYNPGSASYLGQLSINQFTCEVCNGGFLYAGNGLGDDAIEISNSSVYDTGFGSTVNPMIYLSGVQAILRNVNVPGTVAFPGLMDNISGGGLSVQASSLGPVGTTLSSTYFLVDDKSGYTLLPNVSVKPFFGTEPGAVLQSPTLYSATTSGLASTSLGPPNSAGITVTDISASATWTANQAYPGFSVVYLTSGFLFTQYAGTSGSTSPTLPVVGGTVLDGTILWTYYGSSALTANTAYYFNTAYQSVTGQSAHSGEKTLTTANDGLSHIVLIRAGYQYTIQGSTGLVLGCSTTSGSESVTTPGFSGANSTFVQNPNSLSLYGWGILATACGGGAAMQTTDTTAAITTPAQIISTLATGTAPFVVASTTPVNNLTATNVSGSGTVSAASGTFSGLTPGDCVQAGTGGLLTTITTGCSGSLPSSFSTNGSTTIVGGSNTQIDMSGGASLKMPVSAFNEPTAVGSIAMDSHGNIPYYGNGTWSWPICSVLDFSCIQEQENWTELGYAANIGVGRMGWVNTQIGSNATTPSTGAGAAVGQGFSLAVSTTAGSADGNSVAAGKGGAYGEICQSITQYVALKISFNENQATTDETNGVIFRVGGFQTQTATSTPYGCGLEMDTTSGGGNQTSWNFFTDNGTTLTTYSAGVTLSAVSNTWHELLIWRAGVTTEIWMQLDTGTPVCFTSAASGGCTNAQWGTPTVVNSANISGGASQYIGMQVIAESSNAAKAYLGRVAVVNRAQPF